MEELTLEQRGIIDAEVKAVEEIFAGGIQSALNKCVQHIRKKDREYKERKLKAISDMWIAGRSDKVAFWAADISQSKYEQWTATAERKCQKKNTDYNPFVVLRELCVEKHRAIVEARTTRVAGFLNDPVQGIKVLRHLNRGRELDFAEFNMKEYDEDETPISKTPIIPL